MAVDEEMRASPAPRLRFRNHDGMALSGTEPGIQADVAAVPGDPFGAGQEVRLVLRLSGDAGETDVLAELVDRALLVFFEIIEDGKHAKTQCSVFSIQF